MRPTVVIVVDGESTDIVAAVGYRNGVAVLLAGGEREVAERLLLRVNELQRLGDEPGCTAAVEAVREPNGAEGVGAVGRPAAVNVVGKLCGKKRKVKNAVSDS